MSLGPPPLACQDLSVALGGRRVLEALTASFNPREVTAVVGPNGAGKSTWLSTLAGLRRPERGLVTLGAAELRRLAPRDRARRIALLPQSPEVAWSVDVETLVGLGRLPHAGPRGLSGEDRQAVADAIAACGLETFTRRAVDTLSGGERARALIARALAGRPEWLLADEPLTGLDPGHALDAAVLFRRFAEAGGGVVLTVHDLSFAARSADRVVVLGPGGAILADGPPLQALTPSILERAYGVQASWREGEGGPTLHVQGRSKSASASP